MDMLMRALAITFTGFIVSGFTQLPQWESVNAEPAYKALQNSCSSSKMSASMRFLCPELMQKKYKSPQEKRDFFTKNFSFETLTTEGLLTAYFLPLVEGSYARSEEYRYPVWGVPKNFKTPYFTRKEIDQGALNNRENPLLWVKSKVDLFFLQVQGSGKVRLPDGEIIGLGFAAKNGQPYRSIGKLMAGKGLIEGEALSMQGIKAWLVANPSRRDEILWHNPSYVFFQKQEAGLAIGAQGVPLVAKGSAAVDPSIISYGTPILIEAVLPDASSPSLQLAIAQDTGSAIKGETRVDWFLGYGDEAASVAGRMKQKASYHKLTLKKESVKR